METDNDVSRAGTVIDLINTVRYGGRGALQSNPPSELNQPMFAR